MEHYLTSPSGIGANMFATIDSKNGIILIKKAVQFGQLLYFALISKLEQVANTEGNTREETNTVE